jgi:FKBP-type peptidyl-prolyl cis-trans isomerase
MNSKKLLLTGVTVLAISISAAFAADDEKKPGDTAAKPAATQPAPKVGEKVTLPSGLVITVVEEAKQPGALAGDIVWVHYTGKLKSGEQFDSSVGGKPFKFTLGKGEVIKGWDEGLVGMKVGEKRNLTIPPELGYGKTGAGAKIPPDSTLVFDVEMIGLARPGQQ